MNHKRKSTDYKSSDSLTDYQKEFIRMHAGLIPRKQIAKHLRVWESAVADFIRRKRLEQNNTSNNGIRHEITSITRFQICVCDFEGYLPEAIANLYCLYPERVKFLLKEMKESGEYIYHIGKFEISNQGAYEKALKRRNQNDEIRGLY